MSHEVSMVLSLSVNCIVPCGMTPVPISWFTRMRASSYIFMLRPASCVVVRAIQSPWKSARVSSDIGAPPIG